MRDYSKHTAIMVSTDRTLFSKKSAVRARIVEYSKSYRELHVIVFSTQVFENEDITENCTVYSTNSFSKFRYVTNAKKIGKKIIKNVEEDTPILLTCQDPFETGLVGIYLKKIANGWKKDVELMLQIHTDFLSPYFIDKRIGFRNAFLNKIRLKISEKTLPQAHSIRVVSERIKNSLINKNIDPEKIFVKPIRVDTDNIKNAPPSFDLHARFPQFEKIILMISRIEPEKNISLAIESMKLVLAQKPRTGLIIVGSGSEMPKLRKLASRLKIEPSVAFLGWQSDIVSYYKGCDIFLVTSLYEGYGMTLEEARVAGARTVSTNVGIASDVGAEIVGWDREEVARGIMKNLG